MKSYRLMTLLRVILVFIVLTLINNACTKTSLIGEDIFANDTLGIKSTDTITMFTTTVVADSVRTYTSNSAQQLPNYLVGRIDDPIFGNSTAIAYAQLRLLTTSPNFESTNLDSIVLSLPYDGAARHYGNQDGQQTITISRLTEDMDATADIYSTTRFQAGEILGQKTFTANFTDSLKILNPSGDTILEETLSPQLRIPLSSSFGNLLLNTNNLSSIDNFLNFFKGIEIKGSDNNDAMLSFDLVSSYVSLYYTQQDSIFDSEGNFEGIEDVAKRFLLPINSFSAKSVYYNNNRNIVGQTRIDAPIVEYLDNVTDSLTFVQSTQGTMAKVEFPYLSNLSGNIVNKATLEMTVANDDNLTDFSLPEQLIISSELDSNLVIITDVAVSLGTANNFDILGGSPESETINGITYTRYRFNISGHFQDMVDGLVSNTLYITTYPKPQIANRVVLGGAGHSTFPIKLYLNYTKVD